MQGFGKNSGRLYAGHKSAPQPSVPHHEHLTRNSKIWGTPLSISSVTTMMQAKVAQVKFRLDRQQRMKPRIENPLEAEIWRISRRIAMRLDQDLQTRLKKRDVEQAQGLIRWAQKIDETNQVPSSDQLPIRWPTGTTSGTRSCPYPYQLGCEPKRRLYDK